MPNTNLVKSYTSTPQPGNPRATEAWALTQAALRLKDAREAADRQAMLAAVRLNWRLWTIFQAELLDPDCMLPEGLRGNVLSLANFVDKHSVEVVARPQPEKLDILISINRELAGGLNEVPDMASPVVASPGLASDQIAAAAPAPRPAPFIASLTVSA